VGFKQNFRLLSNLPDESHNQLHCAKLFAYHFPPVFLSTFNNAGV